MKLHQAGIRTQDVVAVLYQADRTSPTDGNVVQVAMGDSCVVCHVRQAPSTPPSAPATTQQSKAKSEPNKGIRPLLMKDEASKQGESSEGRSEVDEGTLFYACLTHNLSRAEVLAIKEGGYPVLCVHGRDDIIVSPQFGRKVAKLFNAQFVLVEGGHGLLEENGHLVSCPLPWDASEGRTTELCDFPPASTLHHACLLRASRSVCMQVSQMIESVVLGESAEWKAVILQLTGCHLDPDRHLYSSVFSSQFQRDVVVREPGSSSVTVT